MKKLTILLLLIVLFAFSCVTETNNTESGDTATEKTGDAAAGDMDLSYAFGVSIGGSLKDLGVEIDYDSLLEGLKDVLAKDAPKFTPAEANQKINEALQALSAKKGEANIEKGKAFLEETKNKPGVTVTESGLQYEVLTEGDGPKPTAEDTVTVHYVGTLIDGTEFDSSVSRGEPATFPLNGVIPGWTEGVQLMSVGSKYKFYIPSELGYGPGGAGNLIGPNSTLIFEVELISIGEQK